MRRRRDQPHSRRGVPGLGDPRVHLVPGQLAALPWLGPLGHLDLQVVRIDQVLAGHAEPPAGHLLDRGAPRVAVDAGTEPLRVLAALAGVRPAAQPVHGDGQGLVRLGRDRPVGHGPGREPAHDAGHRFYFFDRNGPWYLLRAILTGSGVDAVDAQQAAQRHQPPRLVVDQRGVLAEDLVPAAAGGVLKLEHRLRAEQVRLAVPAPLVLPAGVQAAVSHARPGGDGVAGAPADLLGQLVEAHAGQARGRAREAGLDHLGAQADGLEDLRSGVGGGSRHAHLGHDLQQPLAEGLEQVRFRLPLGHIAQDAAPGQVPCRLDGQVGGNGRGTVADEQSQMMALAHVPRLDDQPGHGPRLLPDQVMVHRPGQQQRRDGHQGVGGAHAIGQDDDAGAVGDRGGNLGADLGQPRLQALTAAARIVPPVHQVRGKPGQVAVVVDVHDLGQVRVAEHRARQHDLAAGGRHRLQQVLLRAGDRGQRGDQFLPDRVQRRVGHLGEQLGEVVEHPSWAVRKHRHRGVGAHRPDRLRARARHRGQDDPEFLFGVPVHPLQHHQVGLGPVGRGPRAVGEVVEVDQAGVQPGFVGVFGGQGGLDLLVLHDAAGGGVGQEDAAGLQAALPDHGGGVDVQHADLAGQHDQAVAGHPVPARPQAVAVQDRADDRAVGERDQRGTVPGLHQPGVELVEGAPLGRHLLVVLPRLGDHHEHRVRQGPAPHVQQFQALVEAGRVAAVLVQDREQPLDTLPVLRGRNQVGGQHRLPGPHPVAVAADGVDLAVVGHVPVRMGQRPGREGVGREPAVHQGQRRAVPGIGQVGEEPLELRRGQHALVHDGPGRQAGEVHAALALGPLAQAEAHPLEFQAGLAAGAGDEHLQHVGQHRPRAVPARRDVERHLTPAEYLQPLGGGQPFHGRRNHPSFGSEKGHARRVRARLRKGETAYGAEEPVRDLGENARAVPRITVAALRAPVLQVTENLQGPGHHLVAAAAGQVRDEADAACVMLKTGVVQADRRHALSCRLDHAATVRPGRHWPCYVDITSPEESSTRAALEYVRAGGVRLGRVRYRPAAASAKTTTSPAAP